MTTNQLKRLEIEMNRAINESKNAETARSNRANERITEARDLRNYALTSESNRIQGGHYARLDTETNRSNLAKEQETKRSNLAKEQENLRSNLAKEFETHRSNVTKESETQRTNMANEALIGQRNAIASDQAYNQLIAARNANRIAERQADIAESKIASEETLRNRALDIQQEELDWREASRIEDHTWSAIQSAAKTGIQLIIPW